MRNRIGIYSAHGSLPEAKALGEGFASIDYALNHRSLSDFGANDCESIFTLVAVFGLRGQGRRILEEYRARDVPVLVVDFGYLKREEYWQISLNGLNQLPPFECPPLRFAELGLTIAPMVAESNGPAVLAGQLVGDQAHPFDTAQKWEAFVEAFCAAPGSNIEYRPHPLMMEEGDAIEPLDELLARASKIVTWNSNIGNDAWLAGVRVAAQAPDAMYRDVTPENRVEYFARLACGQWTAEEMKDGSAARFVADHLLTGTPPAPVEAPALLDEEEAPPLPPVLISEVDTPRDIRTVSLAREDVPAPTPKRRGGKR